MSKNLEVAHNKSIEILDISNNDKLCLKVIVNTRADMQNLGIALGNLFNALANERKDFSASVGLEGYRRSGKTTLAESVFQTVAPKPEFVHSSVHYYNDVSGKIPAWRTASSNSQDSSQLQRIFDMKAIKFAYVDNIPTRSEHGIDIIEHYKEKLPKFTGYNIVPRKPGHSHNYIAKITINEGEKVGLDAQRQLTIELTDDVVNLRHMSQKFIPAIQYLMEDPP